MKSFSFSARAMFSLLLMLFCTGPLSAQPPGPYETARQWNVGAEGVGKIIAIKPPATGLDERTLRDLGATLRKEAEGKPFYHVMIFTALRAAKLQSKWAEMKTTKAETALCDRSYVGLYDWNTSTHLDKLDCVLDGANGSHFFALDYNATR